MPQSVSTVLTPEGGRLLSLTPDVSRGRLWILHYDREGEPETHRRDLFVDSLGVLVSEAEATVSGGVGLVGMGPEIKARFRNLTVSRSGNVVYAEDFGGHVPDDWTISYEYALEGGWLSIYSGDNSLGTKIPLARKYDGSWQDFRVEADVMVSRGSAGIRLGTGATTQYSTFDLMLGLQKQEAELTWNYSPPPEVGLARSNGRTAVPFAIVRGFPYRLSLASVDGTVSVAVASPVLWHTAPDVRSGLSSLAMVAETPALVAGVQPYAHPWTRLGSGPGQVPVPLVLRCGAGWPLFRPGRRQCPHPGV